MGGTAVVIMFLYVIVGLVFGLFSMTVANKKGYPSGAWFSAGFFFNIVGLIASAGLPLKRDADEIQAAAHPGEESITEYVARMKAEKAAKGSAE